MSLTIDATTEEPTNPALWGPTAWQDILKLGQDNALLSITLESRDLDTGYVFYKHTTFLCPKCKTMSCGFCCYANEPLWCHNCGTYATASVL